ncbi:hypothetical protein [Rummeliibacillus pycnus]|uniref:hypothetical protein n=1 Tax=Rummeliibacillus pycnus TaxID=101070 RepID=UPI0037C57C62
MIKCRNENLVKNIVVVSSFVAIIGFSSFSQSFLGYKSTYQVAHAVENGVLDRINSALNESNYSDIDFYDVYQVNKNAKLSKMSMYTKVLKNLEVKAVTENELFLIVDLVNTYGDITSNTMTPLKALVLLDLLPSLENLEHINPLVSNLSTIIRSNVIQEKPTKSLNAKLVTGLKDSSTLSETQNFSASSGDTLTYDVHVDSYKEDVAFALSYPNNNGENKTTKEDILMVLNDSSGQIVGLSSLVNIDGTNYQVLSTNVSPGDYVLKMYVLPTTNLKDQTVTMSSVKDVLGGYVTLTKAELSLKGVVPIGSVPVLSASAKGSHKKFTVQVKEPDSTEFVTVYEYKTNYINYFAFRQPMKLGIYKIKVIAENTVSGHSDSKIITLNMIKAVTPKIKNITLSKTYVKPGERITVKTTATGANLEYQYSYKVKGSPYTSFYKKYSSANTLTFKAPSKKGKYVFSVRVQQHNGPDVVENIVFTVK